MNWPMIRTILILPGTVLVYVPVIIYWLTDGTEWGFNAAGYCQVAFWLAIVCFLISLPLMIGSSRLFVLFGDGTPAPWNPPQKLVVRGPYRHVRNPMISGVLFCLAAMSLYFQSWPLAGWGAFFLIANTIYFPLFEEKGLEKRFGEDYLTYKRNVPRWLPRLSPYSLEEKSQPEP